MSETKNETKELLLKDIIQQLPKHLFNPPTIKNTIFFLIKLSICVALYFVALESSNIYITSLATLASGIFLFSLGTIGHDCGHEAYAKPKWLNNLIGYICMTLHGTPYMGWKHFHNTHHANTNTDENDPDRNWIYKHEYEALSGFEKAGWRFFLTKGYFFNSIIHYFRKIFPWAFLIHTKTDNKDIHKQAYTDIVIFFAAMAAIHVPLYSVYGYKAIALHFVTILIAFVGLGLYVRTQHYLLPAGIEYKNKPWVTSRSIRQNIALDFIVNNLNYHIEHHILQGIPHANLPEMQLLVKEILKEHNVHYNEEDLIPFLTEAYHADFTVFNVDTQKEESVAA